MKKTTTLLITLLMCIAASSQVNSYTFAASSGSYSSITGTIPTLTGDGSNATRDEGFVNNIPIGFTFNYLGINYATISASTNGFAALGVITSAAFSNNLATGGSGRPLLAPFWEDINLTSTNDLQYTTSGAPGSRVFVLQWSNVLVDFGATNASLSFQLRLMESTNQVQFVYNQLPGAIQDFSGGASIGITSGATGSGSFLSLNNTSSSPTTSFSTATNSITTKPASGQTYTFTPPVCAAPGTISITNISTTAAIFNWLNASPGTSYEYAISTSLTAPASGTTAIAGSPLAITGLTASTQYYLHVRTSCGGQFSGWNSVSFVTACEVANLPYVMPISNVVAPALPLGSTVEDRNQDGFTWRSYPSAGQGWTDQVVAYVFNYNGTTPADDWFYTRGLNLVAGTSYRLKFKYNNDYTSLYTEKLKVAYGNANNADAMTNILADYSTVYCTTPKTASIDFTPDVSGTYYIGFQAYSDANKDALILDDISVDVRPSCDVPSSLAANVVSEGTSATVSWAAPAIGSPVGYEYAVVTSSVPPDSGNAVTTTSAIVSGLIPNTQYYLHVRTNCGGSFSEWTSFAFATVGNDEPCNAIALIAGALPVCSNNTLATSDSDPYSNCSSPDHTLWFKYTATSNGTIVLHLTTPAAPANPLHGWAGWYSRSGDCPDISLDEDGFCAEFGNNGNNDSHDLISPVLTAGHTYYIMIDGYSDDVGEFCISVPACSPALSVLVSDIFGTTATVSWAGTGTYLVEYGPSGFTPGNDASAGMGGTVINAAVSPQSLTGLTLSTTYDVYIRQNCSASNHGWSNNSAVTSFTTLGPPPVNDEVTGAVNLTVFDGTCAGAVDGTTLNATPSPAIPIPSCGEEAEGYDDDVWYEFTPAPGQLFVSIDFTSTGGNSDLVAQIYTSSDNTATGTLSLLDCSDDGGPGSMPAFASLPVTAGTTYFIRVFTYGRGVNGQFTICVTKALLINDNAPGAITINVDAGCAGAIYTNVGATQSAGEPAGTCSSTTGYATAWYKFTAPTGGAVRISTAGSSGNTLTNTRLALFRVADVEDYNSFTIIGCNEDGATGANAGMSVFYATGLTPGNAYYIEVDKFDAATPAGTFCLTVDKLNSTMLSTTNNCNSAYQVPVGFVPSYTGWVSLMDADSKLVALVRNTAGAPANAYTATQNVNTGPVRKDIVSGEYYLDRSFSINNAANAGATVFVQLFFLSSELANLAAVDPAASLSKLRVTRQIGTGCQPDFIAANGTNAELSQFTSGSSNGVSWVQFNTTSLSNFYVHSVKSYLNVKAFLQGAYSGQLGRHKNVTTQWANVLNIYATSQPYNTIAFGNYSGTENVPSGYFVSTMDTTNILDWILLEIKNASGTMISRRAAFIREDGRVVDLDGVSPVALNGVSNGNYSIAIRHRNHLGIRAASTQNFVPAMLGVSRSVTSYDFTTDQNKAYQNPAITTNAAMKDLGNGIFGMWSGNANSNSTTRASGGNATMNDFLYLVNSVLNGNLALIVNAYNAADLNMDGVVRASGGNASLNDFLFLVNTVLDGSFASIFTEHL